MAIHHETIEVLDIILHLLVDIVKARYSVGQEDVSMLRVIFIKVFFEGIDDGFMFV